MRDPKMSMPARCEVSLPSPDAVLNAREWLRAGCPALTRAGQPCAANSIATLRRLVDALPSHLPLYCYGSDEWRPRWASVRTTTTTGTPPSV